MPIDRSKIRQDILDRPCERCDEVISEDDYASENEPIISFFRGSFIMLHNECAQIFVGTAQKGPRPATASGGREEDGA